MAKFPQKISLHFALQKVSSFSEESSFIHSCNIYATKAIKSEKKYVVHFDERGKNLQQTIDVD